MSMKLTVAMPVYNSETYIEETIGTILNQTFCDFEFLIMEDCSTDNSLEIIKRFEDKRIRLIELPHRVNQPQIRNLGFQLAKGEYIALMDSDDHASLDRLARQVDFLDRFPEIDAISSDYQFMGGSTRYNHMPQGSECIKLSLMFRNALAHPAAMLRKSFLEKTGIKYREDLFVCEDYAFWVDAAKVGNLDNIGEALLYYRTGHNNSTGNSLKEDEKRLARKEILDNIHIRAFRNNGFCLGEEEFQIVNTFFGDANKEIPTMEQLESLKQLFVKMEHLNKEIGHSSEVLHHVLHANMEHTMRKYGL